MAIEIEMKARVFNVEEIRTKLIARFGQPVQLMREDFYFAPRSNRSLKSPQMFRVRVESSGQVFVTGKQKHVTPEGLEVNVENEFGVTDKNALFRIIAKIDFVCVFMKKKITSVFRMDDINVEISEVPPIGYFLEIEALREDKSQADEVKKKIISLFESVGIGSQQYAPSSYTKLLRQARRESGPQRIFENKFVHAGCLEAFKFALAQLPFEEITSALHHDNLEVLKTKFPQASLCDQCRKPLNQGGERLVSLTVEPTFNDTKDS